MKTNLIWIPLKHRHIVIYIQHIETQLDGPCLGRKAPVHRHDLQAVAVHRLPI